MVKFKLVKPANHSPHTLLSHMKTEKHKKNEANGNWKVSTQPKFDFTKATSNIERNQEFNAYLCEWFVSSNIPLKKLNHVATMKFFAKYLPKQPLPAESTKNDSYLLVEILVPIRVRLHHTPRNIFSEFSFGFSLCFVFFIISCGK